ncbi:thioredoxin family protein [Acidovorax sp. HDW3]|uniref:thioredoxin family protein n=1 Tax=Acidovorax sp. HDW3 TaxID=2714923 RepID=UPI001407E5A9|nr:thioredoxin family protein [Acidovorax sp. HDW3]QIL43748.1 thioredoxin family protein [Acidovorax sp. HDW3]
MPYQAQHLPQAPTREAIDALPGTSLLEFGAPWCGHCQGAQPLIAAALASHPQIEHIKVEDGKGQRLGRSFGVKLWPTLIVLRAGQEVARVVRPQDLAVLQQALRA